MRPEITVLIIAVTSVLAVLFLTYAARAFMLATGKRSALIERYMTVRFAHRGLHGGCIAENSLSAFEAARREGYGIELDVRLTSDGEAVVFHDSTLERMCGDKDRVIDLTLDGLREKRLSGTSDGIPTLREVLYLIDGAVPLIVEIKEDVDGKAIARRLSIELDGYRGGVLVESFNPLVLREFKRLCPDVPIGILSADYMREDRYRGRLRYRLLRGLYFNFIVRPEFIAYEKTGAAVPSLRYIRRKFNTPLIAWTVKSLDEELRALGDGFDTFIFEGYYPER